MKVKMKNELKKGSLQMGLQPKKFVCENCKKETYVDLDKCGNCDMENTIKPIPKETYKCYLNNKVYGAGSLEYMHELFTDYVITHKMYGKKECDFKIVKDC